MSIGQFGFSVSRVEASDLSGKVSVVTGGAQGIGRAIAARLAEAGSTVLVADVDVEAGTSTSKEITNCFGVESRFVEADVSRSADLSRLADEAVDGFGSLDVWVNNAGVFPLQPVLEMTDEDWDRVIGINLRGAFIGSREAARRMVAAGRTGVIVNVASTGGFQVGGPLVAHYVTSKHGLLGLTKAMAVELGGQGVRVLAVAPTVTNTPGLNKLTTSLSPGGSSESDLTEAASSRPPNGWSRPPRTSCIHDLIGSRGGSSRIRTSSPAAHAHRVDRVRTQRLTAMSCPERGRTS